MRADRLRLGALPAALVTLVALVLSACSGPSAGTHHRAAAAPPPAPRISTYVALGDSYTAAPFVPATSLASGCLRSDHNYPVLLAHQLGAHLRDVSCSAATTTDVLHSQVLAYGDLRTGLRPQIAAVRRGTDLVTVGLGGNDGDLFGTLVHGCSDGRSSPSSCGAQLRARLGDPTRVLRRTGRRVAAVLRAVHGAAPDARVVLVGYPRLVAPGRSCAALPLMAAERRLLARVEVELDRALSGAARRTSSTYLDVRNLSKGHEICSPDPWVNGAVTDPRRAAAFHPFAAEQQAVAAALHALLER